MAFYSKKFNEFKTFLDNMSHKKDFHQSAVAENFLLEERLSNERENSYEKYISPTMDFNSWNNDHEEYIFQNIYTLSDNPETFTKNNSPNILSVLDKNQYVVRLENLNFPCLKNGIDTQRMMDYLDSFIHKKEKKYTDFIDRFIKIWNDSRDKRPIFIGFWGEVKEFFEENGKRKKNDNWPNQLRDAFGLGHLDPCGGESVPVILLRYRVRDILKTSLTPEKAVAVPTVLDSEFSPFFCPVPLDGWNEGQTINLSIADDNDYNFNCELIHSYIDYQTSYIYDVGKIDRAPGRTGETARKIHLELLSDEFKLHRS